MDLNEELRYLSRGQLYSMIQELRDEINRLNQTRRMRRKVNAKEVSNECQIIDGNNCLKTDSIGIKAEVSDIQTKHLETVDNQSESRETNESTQVFQTLKELKRHETRHTYLSTN